MSLRVLARAVCVAVVAAGCSASQVVPTPAPSATANPTPTASSVAASATSPATPGIPGAITGKLGYPSDFIPALRIYAIDPTAPGRYRVVHTAQNQQTYLIAGVAPGTYFVYASAYSLAGPPELLGGAYTKAVACGLSSGCTDHTPVAVQVRPGAVADGVDVRDWYAPPGAYPSPPTGREPFKNGDPVVVDNPQADEVNARDSATVRGKILRTIPNGTLLTIQGGPTTADGYDWYPTQIVPDPDVKLAFVAGFALRKR
jgi:hypothetical protein